MAETKIQQSAGVPVLVGAGTVVIGIGLGFALPPVGQLLQRGLAASPFPTPGLVRLAGELPWAWSVPILAAVGVVAGIYVAYQADREALTLRVEEDHLIYAQDGSEGWVTRTDVSAIYLDGRYLIFLDHVGLIRHRLDADTLKKATVQEVLQAHHFPWCDRDPFEAEYCAWIDGRSEFDADEHRLLRRLQRDSKDADARADVIESLQQAGLVTRQRNGRIEVRRTRPCPGQ